MENRKINQKQLFSLMFLFTLSSVVTNLAPNAKQDVWVSILIGMSGSIVLFFFVYCRIFIHYPTLPYTGILIKAFNKFIGLPLSLVYISYFIYLSAATTLHVVDTITTNILSETPVAVVGFILIVLVSYGCYLGIEVLGRTAEILFIWMVIFGLVGNTSVIASGIIKLNNLQPVLESGWLAVLKHAYPLSFSFPFGEIFVFLMLLPSLNKPEMARKIGSISLLTSGLCLSWTFLLIISVIGPIWTEASDIPLLSLVEKVNIAHIIQRMDSIVVGTFVVGYFIKISIYFYAVVIGLADVFKIKKYQRIIIPSAFIIFILINLIGNKLNNTRIRLDTVPYFVEIPLLIGIPFILLLTIWVRKAIEKS